MCVDHNSGTGQTPGTVTQPNNLTDQEVIIEADEQVFAPANAVSSPRF